jgi:glycosyltransferase 2 family protein
LNYKKIAVSTVKIGISLSLGVFFIWIVWRTLTPSDIDSILNSFSTANYWWIALSIFFGVCSHLSRAHRWKYTLEPLGHTPRFWNSLFSVMVGYLLNLAFPRLGEVTRCAVMSRYEKIPVNELFGTVIAERVADLIIMIIMTSAIIFLQLDVLNGMLSDMLGPTWESISFNTIAIYGAVLSLLGAAGIYLLFRLSDKIAFFAKIKSFLVGIFAGIKSILQMKQKWGFLFHTAFIWVMYVLMFYVSLKSLPETSNVPLLGILAAFVMGGLSIIFVQGGLGVYPAAIMAVLMLYGVERADGLALGWIMWTAQTVLLIVIGFVSMALLPVYNKKDPDVAVEPNS